jgi:1-acyl-sn-glycerol-3-phosphate acyltransferase
MTVHRDEVSNYTNAIRSVVFYLVYVPFTLVFCSLAPFVFGLLPFTYRSKGLTIWNYTTIFLLKSICGVRYQVTGLENVPSVPSVFAAKHQSAWETYFFQILFHRPLSTILKRELLRVPFFGWCLALMRPIAIDRSAPREALKQVLESGKRRIAQGISVLVFPEGSRIDPGKSGKYARSAASIAESTGAPLIPIAHNAGECWSKRSWIIRPGCIRVIIDPPINPEGKTTKQLTDMLEASIEGHMQQITGTATA